MAHSDKHEGGSLCGEVRFEVSGQPELSGVCHCRYCQLRSGSALDILSCQSSVVDSDQYHSSLKSPT